MKKMLLVISALLLTCCTNDKSASVEAKDGKDAVCSTTQTPTGSKVTCSDGTVSELKNVKGDKGNPGLSVKGDKGDRGDKGDVGASVKGDKGEPGQSVTGPTGSAGKNAVVKVYTATVAQCPNSGLVIDTFTDTNSNNTYDAGDTNYQRSLLCATKTTVTETEDEHHEKYHKNHRHNKDEDSDCESGKLDN